MEKKVENKAMVTFTDEDRRILNEAYEILNSAFDYLMQKAELDPFSDPDAYNVRITWQSDCESGPHFDYWPMEDIASALCEFERIKDSKLFEIKIDEEKEND